MLFSRFITVSFAMALSLTACNHSNSQAVTPSTASAVAVSAPSNLPIYRVGVDPTYQPFISRTNNGELEGFDVDVLREIGKREGFAVEFVPKPWSGIFAYLDDKSLDMITGGAVATEERRQKWAVSNPYYQVTTVLVVKENSPIKTYEDAKDKRVAYTAGGSVERTLKKLQGTETLDATQNFASSWLRVKSVMTNGSDAAIGTSASFEYYAVQYPEQKLRVIYPTSPEYDDVVFVLNQSNTELLNRLNKGLASLEADGTLNKLKEKWKMNTAAKK
ncbi:substrate-binding periplasmic protein [Alysiella crassa]|uniref:Probable amino-acid ABC transporter-binding protein HI_1080 n=2 Tax=Alysiella crassa TaxID=153491 RepID=A0A376BM71_9NEIS|nr:transporter substrate-binding domain-containing protein [Alysiella crassa]SSY70748.1 Probable amino-acid ABC transporter-binding protein HI_1080 precursor [Alysiella crassa]